MSACLIGWIYLRDRDTNWQPSEPQLAHADAADILTALHEPSRAPHARNLPELALPLGLGQYATSE